jgi:hypothetical protein
VTYTSCLRIRRRFINMTAPEGSPWEKTYPGLLRSSPSPRRSLYRRIQTWDRPASLDEWPIALIAARAELLASSPPVVAPPVRLMPGPGSQLDSRPSLPTSPAFQVNPRASRLEIHIPVVASSAP